MPTTTTLVDQNGNPLIGKPKTSGYKPVDYQWFTRPRDLPPFTFDIIRAMLLDPTVRLGLKMRAAPLLSVEFAHKEGKEWVPGVQADRPDVAAFVLRQLKRIWETDIDQILLAQVWGWAAAEVTYRVVNGQVEVDRLLSRNSADVRVLLRDGEPVGVRFLRVTSATGGIVDLPFPKSVWTNYGADPGCEYGTSALKGSYSPWADKCFEGGAVDVRRLFMHKDAYGGVDIGYPPGSINIDGRGEVPNRDIAREMAEQAKSGSVTTRPMQFDMQTGKEMWAIERATVPSNPTHILQYPKDLDTEILRGMEIPDDVLLAEATGSWQGKLVPMQAFYTGLEIWLRGVVSDIVTQVIEPLVALNHGEGRQFIVTTKPLFEQAMERQAEKEKVQPGDAAPRGPQPFQQPGQNQQQPGQPQRPAQQPGQPGQPARMSLDPVQAVGEGVLSATELVTAARKVMRKRLSTEVHAYSSTQFNLPHDLALRVIELASRIHPDDLADDGVEFEPHITVKYGLHTDDPEEVRTVVEDSAPIAVTFGKTSVFAGEEHDVVKIEIESGGLRALNEAISEKLACTDTHPQYKPHCTIAYVKSGLGEHYAAKLNDLMGTTVAFDRLFFSDKRRLHYSIGLMGKSVRFANA